MRVEALSDGVFAIIITILVLQVAVPSNLPTQALLELGKELRSTLTAWSISFLITAMYWVGHRDLFSRVRFVNRDLVWLNMLFLLPACLIPFASEVLGAYPDLPKATHVYGVVLIAVTVMRTTLYAYVMRRPRLLWDPTPEARPWLGLAIASAPIAVYTLAIVIADVSTAASVALYFSVPILYFLLITLLRERGETRDEAEDFS